jgi:glycosyltransferase involved in cell wall biosynthesis
MPNTTDPRRFWSMTRIALLPSLWLENQPLTAIEAMINGIPVIGSDRGGIPETLGDSGVVLPLPGRLTPASRILPSAEEVEPWVEAVIRLWDDQAWYDELSRKAWTEAQRWHPDRLRPLYAEFFGSDSQGAQRRRRAEFRDRPGPARMGCLRAPGCFLARWMGP